MNTLNVELSDGFIMSELGPLPEEWKVVKLEKVADFKLGRTPSRSKESYWCDGIYPWVSIADMKEFGFIYDTSEKVSQLAFDEIFKAQLVPKDTLLMSFKLTIGRTSILKVDALHNEAIISIYPKNGVSKEFLFYFLPTINFSKYYDNVVKGKTLNSSKIKNLLIPLPPLSEQQKIAAVLSSIQEAKEKTEAVISAAKGLKKSMMKYLFIHGPVPTQEAEDVLLQETEIGIVPKLWTMQKLEDIFDVQQGKQLSAKEKKEGKIRKPFLRTSNLSWGYINIANVDEMYFTSKEFEKLRLKEGDILVCEGGDVGRTALYRGEIKECAYQNHLHRLRPKKGNVCVEFFVFWMEYAITQLHLYIHTANKTTIPNLSASRLKSFTLPLPPLPEQQKIASILSAIDEKIEAEESKKQALEDLFRSMLHNLMTAKIRVNNLKINIDEEL